MAPADLFALLDPTRRQTRCFFISAVDRAPSGTVESLRRRVKRRHRPAARWGGFQSPPSTLAAPFSRPPHHGTSMACRARRRPRHRASLEALGLSPRAADRVGALSGGLRRRVELAKRCCPNRLCSCREPSRASPTASATAAGSAPSATCGYDHCADDHLIGGGRRRSLGILHEGARRHRARRIDCMCRPASRPSTMCSGLTAG